MDRLAGRFDSRAVLEVVATVAAYNMVSRLLVALTSAHRCVSESAAQFPPLQKARVLAEALPFIRAFHASTLIIRFGGGAMADPGSRKASRATWLCCASSA
jgi:hypothetical protein